MSYTARFSHTIIEKRFWKEVSLLPQQTQEEVLQGIHGLEQNPRPFGQKPFKQLPPPVYIYDEAARYRIRIGNYRVLYDVDDVRKIVWVIALRKRNEATYR